MYAQITKEGDTSGHTQNLLKTCDFTPFFDVVGIPLGIPRISNSRCEESSVSKFLIQNTQYFDRNLRFLIKIKIIVSGILPRNKGNSFRRQKLLQTNNMLKEKCSQIPNVRYLKPESDWVKTNTELERAYQYKYKLQIVIIFRTLHPRKLQTNLWTQIFLY